MVSRTYILFVGCTATGKRKRFQCQAVSLAEAIGKAQKARGDFFADLKGTNGGLAYAPAHH